MDKARNAKGWQATETEYRLVFREDRDGIWRETSNNLVKYYNMILADYLSEVGIDIPDGTQFLRIKREDLHFEYRAYGGSVCIDADIYKHKTY